jgi:hypothetical protein
MCSYRVVGRDSNNEALILLTAAFVSGRLLFRIVATVYSELPFLRSPMFILTFGANAAVVGLNCVKLYGLYAAV